VALTGTARERRRVTLAQSGLNRESRPRWHPPANKGCVGIKTLLAACRATAHLAGSRRLAAAVWHAVTEQLASCAVAETLDFVLIRPGCLAGAAWLLLPLPGGVWLGLALGKATADVIWYGTEASVRRAVARTAAI
jgi:hypothetical protein